MLLLAVLTLALVAAPALLARFGGGDGPAVEPARLCVLMLALCSAGFAAAGGVHLMVWRVSQDPHHALVGTAVFAMGAVCLPLPGVAALVAAAHDPVAVGPLARCAASFVVIALVLHAVSTSGPAPGRGPALLLKRLVAVAGCGSCVLILAASVSPRVLPLDAISPIQVSGLLTLGWLVTAARLALAAPDVVWAGRTAPLFLGLSVAEMLRGLDDGAASTYTLSALLVCASVAAFATRRALRDLDLSLTVEEEWQARLSGRLDERERDLDLITAWREQLVHDARNSCAGVRAAVTLSMPYDGPADPQEAERLREAAIEEIEHLEHLIGRRSGQPVEAFDVGDVVRQVVASAQALGAEQTVRGTSQQGLGRPRDLTAVLKQLVGNAQAHAPGSRVEIRLADGPGGVAITVADDGPGVSGADAAHVFERGYRGGASSGSGLGLYAARELMREQRGDLVLLPTSTGAGFRLTLPAAPARTSRQTRRAGPAVPEQRVAAHAALLPAAIGSRPAASEA